MQFICMKGGVMRVSIWLAALASTGIAVTFSQPAIVWGEMKRLLFICTISCGLGFVSQAQAQDLVYTPVNPSFGGNPFNSAHLLAIANAQNDFEPEAAETSTQSDLDRFVSSLQSRLLSSLSTQVANAIFGEDAQDEGTVVFGDQTITFVRGLDGIELTITEADGSQTVITVPVFTSLETDPDDTSGDASGALIPLTSPLVTTTEAEVISSQPLISASSLLVDTNQPIQ